MSTATVSTRKRSGFTRDAHIIRLFGILLALTAFFLIVRSSAFLSAGTWQSMGVQFPEYGLMALGVMLTMITGGIDLSVVGIANMSAIAAASIMLKMAPAGADEGQQAAGIAVGILVALVMGALAGLFNGFLVAKVKIPAILVTLGTLELFTGIAIIISAGRPVSGLPPVYGAVFGGKVLGVPIPLIVFAVVAVAIWFVLHRMAFGSKLYMLGSNATAAKFSGLNSTSLLLRTYMISGLASAIAGLVMLANYNSAKADYGVAYTLLTILIVVLGGVHPNGGSGKLIGVVLAIAILQILSSGLNMFPNISNFYRPLIWGAVLLIVISTQDLGKDLLGRFKKRKEK
ncbi:MAG: ABC transporter permease [Propionibacteriaceae bacterium]|nr:ABC transporter permease [Propionibacteriaceae bacterium]